MAARKKCFGVTMENIVCGIQICVHNYTAGLAGENTAFSLACLEAPADGTGFGSVLCGNVFNHNTSFFSFVGEEFLKLVKSPVGEKPILLMPMSRILDSFQVFQYHDSISSGTIYQFTADAMIHIPHKTFFPSAHFAKMPCCGTGAFALQNPTQTNITLFDFPDMLTVEKPAIGCGNEIIDAPVNSYDVSSHFGEYCWGFDGYHQPEFSISTLDHVAFLRHPSEVSFEISADLKLDFDSSLESKDRRGSLFKIDIGASGVEVNCLAIEEGFSSYLPTLIRFHFSLAGSTGILICNNCKLSWKAEFSPEGRISFVVNFESVGFLFLETHLRDEVLSFRNSSKGIIKIRQIRRNNFHFSLHCSHHGGIRKEKVYISIGVKNCTRNFSHE